MRYVVIPLLFAATACSGHIAKYEPKHRKYTPSITAQPAKHNPNTDGSLLTGNGLGATLFADVRTFGVGDVVTVRVVERSTAERSTSTDLDRSSEFDSGFDLVGGLANVATHNPTFDPSRFLNQKTKSRHRGSGRTSRRDRIAFVVAAQVQQVLPNGDLFIEGNRVVKVNNEEHHFYVSGVARAADIGTDNSVMSTYLADAEVEFFGEGELTQKSKQGWLGSVLDWIWPF